MEKDKQGQVKDYEHGQVVAEDQQQQEEEVEGKEKKIVR